ncbi:PAS domain S-box protein [Bacillaceae bacterium IKA-2]|nr:PAS domain S-box protein [Bacillaceae bacterium IKA-2]
MNAYFYKQLIEESRTGFAYLRIICDENGLPCDYEFIEVNRTFEEFTGLRLSEIVGKKPSEIIPSLKQNQIDWMKVYGEIASSVGKKEFEYYSEYSKGWYRVNVYSPEKNYLVTVFNDISEGKQVEEKLMKSREKMTNIIEGTNVGTWEWNLQTGETVINERWAKIIGYTIAEISPIEIGTWLKYVHPDDLERSKTQLKQVFLKKIKFLDLEGRMKHKDGSWVWVQERGLVTSWSVEGRALAMSGTHIDITERKQMEETIFNEKERFKTTLLSVADGVISTDNHGKVLILNKIAEQLTGWTQEEAFGEALEKVFNIVNEFSRDGCENAANKVLETVSIVELENNTILISKEGVERFIEDSVAPIMDEDHNIKGAVLVFRDVTEKKKKQKEIEFLSFHDHLTGLYNRRFFEEQLSRLDTERNLHLSLIIADVNGLKLANDAFGHLVGDRILKRIAEVIKRECRADDIIARIGGDEFAILLPNTNSEVVEILINRLKEAINMEMVDAIRISASFGSETKRNISEKITDIYKKAEDRMYRHKLSESQSMRNKTVKMILTTLHQKSEREKQHSERVSKLSGRIGVALGLSAEDISDLIITGSMHDIGKIAIDFSILEKPDKLKDLERIELERHPEAGYQILRSLNEFSNIAEYVLAHHERWDGKGYPKRLKGKQIPLKSRIIAVAGSYDTMTNEQPYRQKLSSEAAIEEIKKHAGTQFDPNIALIFIEKVLCKT